MKTVILAGGSGTRLFPLSREELPKQFIKIFDQSLFQKTVLRALLISKPSEIFVVANEKHKFKVLDQLSEIGIRIPEENILLEPVAKSTLPATLYALQKIEDAEKVAVLPSDHLIDATSEYIEAFRKAEALAENYIVTFGIKPTHPHTGYGYIITGKEIDGCFEVEKFVEKPDKETARKIIEKSYWNSGMFVFKKSIFIEECRKFAENILSLDYASIPEISIDKGVMEKTDKAAVVPLRAFWSDVGSFDSLYEALPKDANGNVTKGDVLAIDSQGVLAFANRCLAVVGLKDAFVIDEGDVVLLCSKGASQKVKEVVKILKERGDKKVEVHRTAYRPWGSYTVLEEGQFYKIKRLTVLPKKRLSLQRHYHRSEHWVVVRGIAKVTVDNKEILLRSGESVYVEAGVKHRIENPGMIPLEVIEVQIGELIDEEDIERFEDDFGRLKSSEEEG